VSGVSEAPVLETVRSAQGAVPAPPLRVRHESLPVGIDQNELRQDVLSAKALKISWPRYRALVT
jgi:hypothetical protein